MKTKYSSAVAMVSMALVLVCTACSGGQVQPEAQAGQARTPRSLSSPAWPEPADVDHDVIKVGFAPHRLSVAAGSVWVASLTGAVHKIRAEDDKARVVTEVGSSLAAAAVARGRLFVGDNRGSRVLVYDQESGEKLRILRMPGPVRGVLSALGSVWVTAGDSVVRLDPATLGRRSVTKVGGEAAQLAAAGQVVAVTNRVDFEVTGLDATGRVVGVADVGGPTIGITVTNTQIWVLRTDRPAASVLSRERFAPIGMHQLPGISYDATLVGGEVWATMADQGTVARLSPTGEVLGQFVAGRRPLGIVANGKSVWVANEGESSLWRLSADLSTVGT